MKKLVLAALAIGTMAACTKSNVQLEQPGELEFQPVMQKATKATTSVGEVYPENEKFNVWAWWVNSEGGDTSYPESESEYTDYIEKGTFAQKENTWGGWDISQDKPKPYYWPTTGSLFFAGYSPADAYGNFNYILETQTLSIQPYTQPYKLVETKDLMWFDVLTKTYDKNDAAYNGVSVVFRHALSWLTFNFNLKDNSTEQLWTIKHVELRNIKTTADFTATLNQTPIWDNYSNPMNITVFEGSHKLSYDSDGTVLEGSDVALATTGDVLVIPQPCTEAKLVITYDLQAPTGEKLQDQEVTLPVNTVENSWVYGKHYIYTIIFGANEILIAPTVKDWGVEYVNVPVK